MTRSHFSLSGDRSKDRERKHNFLACAYPRTFSRDHSTWQLEDSDVLEQVVRLLEGGLTHSGGAAAAWREEAFWSG